MPRVQRADFLPPFFSNKGDVGDSPVDETLFSMMNVFSIATYTTCLDLPPHSDDYRVPLLSLQVGKCCSKMSKKDKIFPIV